MKSETFDFRTEPTKLCKNQPELFQGVLIIQPTYEWMLGQSIIGYTGLTNIYIYKNTSPKLKRLAGELYDAGSSISDWNMFEIEGLSIQFAMGAHIPQPLYISVNIYVRTATLYQNSGGIVKSQEQVWGF